LKQKGFVKDYELKSLKRLILKVSVDEKKPLWSEKPAFLLKTFL
jgi:hypothetical protein